MTDVQRDAAASPIANNSAAKNYDVTKIKTLLHEIVPEYVVGECDGVLGKEPYVERDRDWTQKERRKGDRRQ